MQDGDTAIGKDKHRAWIVYKTKVEIGSFAVQITLLVLFGY